MKDKNTGVQHATGVLCTPGNTLVLIVNRNSVEGKCKPK